MKKRFGMVAASLAVLVSVSSPANAQGEGLSPQLKVMADRLSTCMVENTSAADRQNVIRWLVLSMAAAPQVKNDITIEAGAKDDADRKMAALFTRLVTKDCAEFARPLFQSGTRSAFELAFAPLGRVAARDAFSDPSTAQAMMSYAKYIDLAELMKLMQ
ncbi:MAG: hypothetical protein U1E37_11210 [Sphingomonadaceae bacterium]